MVVHLSNLNCSNHNKRSVAVHMTSGCAANQSCAQPQCHVTGGYYALCNTENGGCAPWPTHFAHFPAVAVPLVSTLCLLSQCGCAALASTLCLLSSCGCALWLAHFAYFPAVAVPLASTLCLLSSCGCALWLVHFAYFPAVAVLPLTSV